MLKSSPKADSKNENVENKIIKKLSKIESVNNMVIMSQKLTTRSDKNKNKNLNNSDDVKKTYTMENNIPKAKIISIEDNYISPFEVLQDKSSKSKSIKRPSDIEISFSSKQKKISRQSLPANLKQSVDTSKTVLPTKSFSPGTVKPISKIDTKSPSSPDNKSVSSVNFKSVLSPIKTIRPINVISAPPFQSALQTKSLFSFQSNSPDSATKIDDISYGVESLKGSISVLNKKLNLHQNPQIHKSEPVKIMPVNSKLSPKKIHGLPLNLDKMFHKKDLSNSASTKSPNQNKIKVSDKKSPIKLKPKKNDKRKSNLTYYFETSKSPEKKITKFFEKNNTPSPKLESQNKKKVVSPIKIEALEMVLSPKKDIRTIPGIPSFSVNSASTEISVADIQKDKSTEKSQLTPKMSIPSAYSNLLDTYRYLITPKSWSVMEMATDIKNQCIVFFNANIMKERNVYVSVMKKSLIIDKNSKMHYSVHGLPVDLTATILPKVLDSTKKLLSILHIFDKMQVCEGIGDDLDVIQDEAIFKDTCRIWRHRECKIILMKSTRCLICAETREVLIETET